MRIFINDKPFDVMDYYRPHGFSELPPTPTMNGYDIVVRAGVGSDYNLVNESEDRTIPRREWHNAIALKDGMKFSTYPPCGFA